MPPTVQAPVKFGDFPQLQLYFFVSFQQIMIRLGIFTNFKALFLSGITTFCLLVPVKCGENRETKQQLCMCITIFSKFLWRSLHNDVKPRNATFYGGSERTTTNFSSPFWTWIMFLRIQLQEKSQAYIWQFGRVQIDAISLNGRKFIFLLTFQCRHRCRCLSFLSTEKQGLNQPIATTENKRCDWLFITASASDHQFSENNINK